MLDRYNHWHGYVMSSSPRAPACWHQKHISHQHHPVTAGLGRVLNIRVRVLENQYSSSTRVHCFLYIHVCHFGQDEYPSSTRPSLASEPGPEVWTETGGASIHYCSSVIRKLGRCRLSWKGCRMDDMLWPRFCDWHDLGLHMGVPWVDPFSTSSLLPENYLCMCWLCIVSLSSVYVLIC